MGLENVLLGDLTVGVEKRIVFITRRVRRPSVLTISRNLCEKLVSGAFNICRDVAKGVPKIHS